MKLRQGKHSGNAGQRSPIKLGMGDHELGREMLLVAFYSLACRDIAQPLC